MESDGFSNEGLVCTNCHATNLSRRQCGLCGDCRRKIVSTELESVVAIATGFLKRKPPPPDCPAWLLRLWEEIDREDKAERNRRAFAEAKHAILASAGFIGGISVLDRAGIEATLKRAYIAIQAASGGAP